MNPGLLFALVCAVLAIVYGVWQIQVILRLPEGNERMREIAAAVREGAIAYLWRQYKTIAMVGAVLFFLIGFFLDWASAWGFPGRWSSRPGRRCRHRSCRAGTATTYAASSGRGSTPRCGSTTT